MMLLYRYGAIFFVGALKCEAFGAAACVAAHVFNTDHSTSDPTAMRELTPRSSALRSGKIHVARGGKQIMFSAAMFDVGP